MTVIRVAKAFTLNRPDAKPIRYDVGDYDVAPDIADHWYVRAHLFGAVAPPPPSPYAQKALEVEQAVRIGGVVEAQAQPPAPIPPGVEEVMQAGAVPDGAFYFAGKPQEDKEMPGKDTGGIAYAQPPGATRRPRGG